MREELLKPRGKAPLCACGCGNPVKWDKWHKRWNNYINGHTARCLKTRAKISKFHKGKEKSAEHRENLSKAAKKRFENPAERMKISKFLTGKKLSAETKRKISVANTGKKKSEEHRRKHIGLNNSQWKNGISLENKPSELTDEYKQAIRKRDNFTCQFCGHTNNGEKQKLDIHHIDEDRHNNCPDNILTLCRDCHAETRTIGDKVAWQRVYSSLMKKIKRQNPEGHQACVELYEQNMKIYY